MATESLAPRHLLAPVVGLLQLIDDQNFSFCRPHQTFESREVCKSLVSLSLWKQAGWDYLLAGIDSHVDMKGEGRVR